MGRFEIAGASADDIRTLGAWAADEGWNPGDSDGQAFFPVDPEGFLFGRLDGEPVASISAVRYGTDFGFVGFYIARPSVRGQGYGIQLWRAGTARLAGRNVGLDGVIDQQDNYRASGFRRAWNNIRYEGVPSSGGVPQRDDVTLRDARTVPIAQLAAYDRRFFPAPRPGFLASWVGLPDRTALVAVRDGRLDGFGVLRASRGASRVGPLYAASQEVAAALVSGLAAASPGSPVAIDVPDVNTRSVELMERLGLRPSFEAARMYTGPTPAVDLTGLYAVTSLELG
ncbi:GNAT family N-acetyltransferase [Streptomyces liangshanensis]|uniref:GNAT family N-acetyltransferase n=1 Tax=Streptomyces liangshanensis TaxID=2717324 RepID=A0A6G9H2L4_9ACTN|nr:GNAT family N-acetyltransferase [Streptomyces liangshanensis]QIQ04768.1 GNAT family N-acetyltransferase [Streptomyces liangshanensis]